ncbi:MAG: tetratricopeptide repeat protein [Casimicrobiaceae bacterium]
MIKTTLCLFLALAPLFSSAVLAQQAPPPPPTGTLLPPPPPGLTTNLAEASRLIRDGDYAGATEKIEAALAQNARDPQARFLRGIVQTDQGDTDEAIATFVALTEDYPELPEPHNNLAVIWAQKGRYDKARIELEIALAAHPDYAIAHENLGDVYSRLAGAEYDRALSLDKTNKSAQSKLALVRELYAVAPSASAPKPVVPKPAPVKNLAPPKPKK